MLVLLLVFSLLAVGIGLLIAVQFMDGPDEKVVAASTVGSILSDVEKQIEQLEDLEDIVEASTSFDWKQDGYGVEGSKFEGVLHIGDSSSWKDLIIDTDLGQVDIQFKQGDQNEIVWKAITTPEIGEHMQAAKLKGEQLVFELDESDEYHKHEYRYSFVITLRDDYTLRKLQLEQEIGEIDLKGGKFEKIELQMDNGILRASDVVSRSMDVELDNGSVEFERVDAPIMLESDNGEIKMLDTTQPVKIKLDLGNINLAMKQPHNVDVKTNMGMTEIKVPQGVEGKYEVKSGLGEVEVPSSDNNGIFRVNVKSDAGTIIVRK